MHHLINRQTNRQRNRPKARFIRHRTLLVSAKMDPKVKSSWTDSIVYIVLLQWKFKIYLIGNLQINHYFSLEDIPLRLIISVGSLFLKFILITTAFRSWDVAKVVEELELYVFTGNVKAKINCNPSYVIDRKLQQFTQ